VEHSKTFEKLNKIPEKNLSTVVLGFESKKETKKNFSFGRFAMFLTISGVPL
jgi:hypothetical protein